jgi:hypothetical protein
MGREIVNWYTLTNIEQGEIQLGLKAIDFGGMATGSLLCHPPVWPNSCLLEAIPQSLTHRLLDLAACSCHVMSCWSCLVLSCLVGWSDSTGSTGSGICSAVSASKCTNSRRRSGIGRIRCVLALASGQWLSSSSRLCIWWPSVVSRSSSVGLRHAQSCCCIPAFAKHEPRQCA